MNIRLYCSAALIVSFSVLASAQDSVNAVPDSGKWFADTNSAGKPAVPAEPGARDPSAGPADTLAPADSNRTYTIVVTATRREQPSEWVSDDHVLINAEYLAQSTSKTMAELLAAAVPAHMSDMGGGTVKNISLMGAGSERTLVLLDGKRIGTQGNDIGDIPPEIVQKIEILEGGQSALYGMDAVGGVVNIITKQQPSSPMFGSMSTTFSSYDSRHEERHLNTIEHNFTAGMKRGRIQWLAGADWQSGDGRYEYQDDNGAYNFRDNNGFTNWGFYQKAAGTFTGAEISVSGGYNDRVIGNPGQISAPGQAVTKKKMGFMTVDGSWAATKQLKIKLNAAYERDSIHYIDPNPFWPQDSRHVWSKEDISCIQEFTLGKQMVNTGMQFLGQSVISNEIGGHAAGQWGMFANAVFEQAVSDFIFRETPAVRGDYSTVFKGSLDGKLGLIATWETMLEPSLFFNIGNSFRGPDFNDLYWPKDAYSAGNSHLKPERSVNGNTGVQLRHHVGAFDMDGRCSFSAMRLSDMIIWAPDPAGIYSPSNVSRAGIWGSTVAAHCSYDRTWDLSAAFAYNNSRDRATHKVLIYRPGTVVTVSCRYDGRRASAGASFRYSSKVFTNNANTASLPGVRTLDANVGCTLVAGGTSGKGVRLIYDILNITGEKKFVSEGYPLPGREHRLGLKMNF
jgi:vitamin B12 transporter